MHGFISNAGVVFCERQEWFLLCNQMVTQLQCSSRGLCCCFCFLFGFQIAVFLQLVSYNYTCNVCNVCTYIWYRNLSCNTVCHRSCGSILWSFVLNLRLVCQWKEKCYSNLKGNDVLASYVKVTLCMLCQEGLGVHFTAFEQMIINNSNCVHFLLHVCVCVCLCVWFSLHKQYAHVLPYFSETTAKRKKRKHLRNLCKAILSFSLSFARKVFLLLVHLSSAPMNMPLCIRQKEL